MSTTDSSPGFYPGVHAQKFPDKPAYIMAGSGETVTYGELNDRSNQLAQLLYQRGVRPGDVLVPLSGAPAGAPDGVQLLEQMLWGFTENTLYLSPAPFYHSAPLRFNMGVMRIGGTSILMEHFDPVDFLRLIDEHKIT